MAAHAKFSPSAASRWLNCPGSVKLASVFPRTDSVYSREGTFAHEVAERLLRDKAQAEAAIGWKSDNGEFTVDETWTGYLQEYLDVVYGLDIIEGGEVLVEQRVKVSEACWGTADAVVISHDYRRIHVIDLKWGQGVAVSPDENPQLMTYALGVILGMTESERATVEEVHIHVVQPRREDRKHSSWITDVGTLMLFAGELDAAMIEARKEKPRLAAGAWCKFCPAASTCPKLREESTAMAKRAFSEDAVMSPTEIAKMLDKAQLAEMWAKAVRQRAHELAELGTKIPGYKLVERIGNRKWIDEVDTVQALQRAGVDPWAPRVVLSPAAVEKKLGKKPAEALLSELAVRPKTGTALVPESDRRPAICPPATHFLND